MLHVFLHVDAFFLFIFIELVVLLTGGRPRGRCFGPHLVDAVVCFRGAALTLLLQWLPVPEAVVICHEEIHVWRVRIGAFWNPAV